MSVTGIYRVQCSGGCARWLAKDVEGCWITVEEFHQLAEFRDWTSANKAAAEADWFDGPQGEYAKCSCGYDKDDDADWGHNPYCRVMQPRLVPICPPCRENL